MNIFNHKPKNRWQAFGLHLLVSLGLFIAMCSIIVVFWYPGVLFSTEGGWQGVRLIASIDFVIGPILTLLIYKPGKRGLKFDLTVIALLQTTCITYGMYVVHYSRPAVVAYGDGIYYTTPLLRFDSRNIDIMKSSLLQNHLPVWVNIKLPEDKKQRLQLKIDRFWEGIETSVDLYEPYEKAIWVLPQEGFSLAEATAAGLSVPSELNSKHVRVFKLITRYNTYAVAVDISTGKFITLLGTIRFGELGLVVLPPKSDSMLHWPFTDTSTVTPPAGNKASPPINI